MRELSEIGAVECPTCRVSETIKGVKFLPLDTSVLKKILEATSAEIMSTCSRCYDEVPSYSWCPVCSSALCEFHHQDHKLSMETSQHAGLMTFKEIASRGVHIDPKLPPISCPEVLLQDCTAYCHTCRHVASVHACLQCHTGHKTEDCKVAFPRMKGRVLTSLGKIEAAGGILNSSLKAVRDTLQQLDEEADRSTKEIEVEFEALRKELNAREAAMHKRLQTVAGRKREILQKQLDELWENSKDCEQTGTVGIALLRDTDGTGSDGRAAYLVAMADTIERRLETISENMKKVHLDPQADPIIAVSFNYAELDAIRVNLPALGSIQVSEEQSLDDGKEPEQELWHSRKPRSKHLVLPTPTITFTIKAEPTSVLLPEKASKATKTTSLIIEARAAQDEVKGKGPTARVSPGQGALLGQIIITTEVDKRLLNRHEIRRFFESVIVRNVPVMKLTQEIIPAS